MFTIATAGHIDHGKSSLVKALTGTDPDRLPEEKAREMTIDLGFASLKLSGGEEVGVVDVPGHERFIKTMIAGVGTIDLVMLIVAADDGWMPQSEEHLAILKYLGVERGFVVLTKIDLAERDWIDLVKTDILAKTKGTFLEGCEIIEFSAVDNRNLDQVTGTIEKVLKGLKRSESLPSGRLFVDRRFTVAGTGTVVTGTLREGRFTVGQELLHHPSGQTTRIRSLESFYSHLEEADPGIRLAVGLQGFERSEIRRGDLLYYPNMLKPSKNLAVKLELEPQFSHLFKHNRRMLFLHGTTEVEGKVTLPQETLVCDDGAVIAVLKLDHDVIARIGDRFILRLPTPSVLIGGGRVIDANLGEFKRSDTGRWQQFKAAASLGIEQLADNVLRGNLLVTEDEFLLQSLFPVSEIKKTIDKLIAEKAVIRREKYLILKSEWDRLGQKLITTVERFHSDNKHLESMSLAELQSKTAIGQQLFEYLIGGLISIGKLQRFQAGVKLSSYTAGLKGEQEDTRKQIVSDLSGEKIAISRKELFGSYSGAREVYAFLKQQGEIIDLGGMIYLAGTWNQTVAQIADLIKQKGKITVADARDCTNTTRKVILPILEEMDRRRITRRDGDYRTLVDA